MSNFKRIIHNAETLATAKASYLVNVYNELGPDKEVKRFANKETAIKRILKLQDEVLHAEAIAKDLETPVNNANNVLSDDDLWADKPDWAKPVAQKDVAAKTQKGKKVNKTKKSKAAKKVEAEILGEDKAPHYGRGPRQINGTELEELVRAAVVAATARKPREVNVPVSKASYPIKEGTKQHALADALISGNTLAGLVRILQWAHGTVKSGFGWDMKNKGYGVRTEFMNGEEVYREMVDYDTAGELGFYLDSGMHPDDGTEEEFAAAREREGYDPERKVAVYYLVIPKGENGLNIV
jgi:hypothetical protein